MEFFFPRTVPRDWKSLQHPSVPPETKLPDVLTVEEVRRIFADPRSEPSRTCLSAIYSLGLRLSEGISLETGRVRLRWKKSGSRPGRTMELDALEFLRRFLQHVVPPGLENMRHCGRLSPQSALSIEGVRALVAIENAAAARDAIAGVSRDPHASWTITTPAITEPMRPHCGHRLRVVEILFHRVSSHGSR
jgi:integrase